MNIIVVGDLNIVLNPKERRGGINSRDQILPLVENLIQQWDLLDFKPKKGLYMWTNNRTRATHILAWLDRFLVQSTFCLTSK